MSDHAPLPPSGAERWFNCSGSPKLIDSLLESQKNTTNEHAQLGECVHKMIEIKLRDILTGTREWSYYEGSKISLPPRNPGDTPFSVRVDKKMLEGMDCCVDYVTHLIAKYGLKPNAVALESKSVVSKLVWGRLDIRILVVFDRLIIIDYKNGYHEVDVFMNKQLLIYALGEYLALPEDVREDLVTLQLTVVQPNGASGNKIKSIELPIHETLGDFKTEILEAENRTIEKPELTPGSWCKWCPAESICKPRKAKFENDCGLDVKQLPAVPAKGVSIKTTQLPAIETLTPEQCAKLFDLEAPILDYFKAMHEFVRATIERGTPEEKAKYEAVGFKLEQKWGNRRWKEDHKKLDIALATEFSEAHAKDEFYTKPELLSPAQMEKKLKTLKINFDLAPYIEKPDNGYGLVKVAVNKTETISLDDI